MTPLGGSLLVFNGFFHMAAFRYSVKSWEVSSAVTAKELDPVSIISSLSICFARSYCVAGFKIAILLPQASRCWDCGGMSPHQAFLRSISGFFVE